MATPVEMPQLGNTVEECLITRWIKKEGERVSAGDLVAEIETDKTTFESAAPAGGTMLATFFEEGAVVPVFTNICVIGSPGDDVEAYRPGAAVARPSPAAAAAPAAAPAQPVQPGHGTAGARSAPYSPRARRFAAERNFHPASIAGTGPRGRVLEADVRRAFEARTRVPRTPGQRGTVSGLRATIARRMRESLASTAQYTLHSSADATGLLALRSRIKARASEGMPDITINDLVTFCTIQALLDVPALNVEFIDGAIVPHDEVHIGFAVDTPRGLLAPVIRDAHDLAIDDLSRRMKELSAQAVQGTIAADALTGATFTISNLGSLGIESFTPLINPPQVAILGVGAIQLKPVRRQPGRVRLRETSARRAMAWTESVEFIDSIALSLTCDHQVIDGAPGARFLQAVRKKIEQVEGLVGI